MPGHFTGGTHKTAAKLKILDWYLEKYVDVINGGWDRQPWYVDTHSGSGKTKLENGSHVDGSALRVLDNHVDDFGRFYFYELNPDRFALLQETLSEQLGCEFDTSKVDVEGSDFPVARCEDPYIRIMQTDSNQGAEFLAKNASSAPHWFVFVDPKGLTARKSTLDTLISRGNMDILINYQTTGVFRNASENADGYEAVNRTMGDDEWEVDGDEADYVDAFKARLEEHRDWAPVLTKPLENKRGGRNYRFDLVFASAHETAREIMEYVMDRDDLWEKAVDEYGQSGLTRFTD